MRQTFKFTAQPRRSQREVRQEKRATWAATAAGVGAFLLLGAGWPILVIGTLTYIVVLFLMRRRN